MNTPATPRHAATAAMAVFVLALTALAAAVAHGTSPDLMYPESARDPFPLLVGLWPMGALVAAPVALAAAAAMAALHRTGSFSSVHRALLAPVAAVAVYAGLTYGTVGTPTDDANIGAGLLVLGLVPVLAAAVVSAVWLRRRAR